MEKAREIAAQCWCTEETKHIEMDVLLAEAFATVLNDLFEKIKRLEASEELAWGIIANAYGGDWDLASEVWRQAAIRWRDQFYPAGVDS